MQLREIEAANARLCEIMKTPGDFVDVYAKKEEKVDYSSEEIDKELLSEDSNEENSELLANFDETQSEECENELISPRKPVDLLGQEMRIETSLIGLEEIQSADEIRDKLVDKQQDCDSLEDIEDEQLNEFPES